MDHVTLSLHQPRALQRVIAVLSARGIGLDHVHVDRGRMCLLVPNGARAVLLLDRAVDVSDLQMNGPCLVARNVFVPIVAPRRNLLAGHRWQRAVEGAGHPAAERPEACARP